MKILIVSDTHGHTGMLKKAVQRVAPFDVMIHCGDVEGNLEYIKTLADCPLYVVAGNNDWGSDMDRELEFTLGDYRVFLTHGNRYGVSLDTELIREEGASRGANIVMFGHTHKPLIDQTMNPVLLNPGSLSYPRQLNRLPSFIVMEIDRDHIAHYTINYIEK